MTNDERWMRRALEEAQLALDLGEAPIGAVLVQDDVELAAAHNTRETQKTALGHAEINAIQAGCERLGGWRLPRCTLYVTLEPCPMCAGAIINARIDRVVFGAWDKKAGSMGSLIDLSKVGYNHCPRLTGGVLEEDCAALLSEFFVRLRKSKEEKRSKPSV
jgi:tRNA(adenine34) deaminase